VAKEGKFLAIFDQVSICDFFSRFLRSLLDPMIPPHLLFANGLQISFNNAFIGRI
jgi:hypothetical protein